ncbi:hypothetical protein BDZ89DRAFT_1074792, partial [Hymenopellis radicata]
MSSSNFQAQWTSKMPLEAQNIYNHIRTVAFLLDASYPMFPFLASLPQEMQLDSVIGVALPAVGDAFCLYLALYQVLRSRLFSLPWYVVGLMLFYIVVDAFIGVVPLVGDFLDGKELTRSRWAAAVIVPQSTDWISRPRKTNAS